MFAWISRYNGIKRELGTLNNTCMHGTKGAILAFAKQYGKGFRKVEVSLFYSEENKFSRADETITIDSLALNFL
jgi:hypothetical protein